jgi:hypothetical protein
MLGRYRWCDEKYVNFCHWWLFVQILRSQKNFWSLKACITAIHRLKDKSGNWQDHYFYSYHPNIGVPHRFFWYRLADTASFLSVYHVLHPRICSWGILMSLSSFPPLEKAQGSYHGYGFNCISYCVVSSAVAWKFQDRNKAPFHTDMKTPPHSHVVCVSAR